MQNIFIIGDGGIGSNLGAPLVKFLKFTLEPNNKVNITIIDGDIVENKNLIRQSFITEDIGKKKSDITAMHLADICEGLEAQNIEIKSFPQFLKPDNIQIITNNSMVFVGVDNYITRLIIEEHTKTLDTVLVIFGGNEYDDGDVNIIYKKDGKYLTSLYSDRHPEIKTKDRFPDEIPCEEAIVSAPQLILTNITVAQYMLEGAYSYYSNKGTKVGWQEKMFDLKTGAVRVIL